MPKKTPQLRRQGWRLWGINNRFWRQISPKRAAEARIQSRLDALVELRQSREGLAEGIRKVLERPSLTLAIGVLAELIETTLTPPIDLSLRWVNTQTLVFDTRQSAHKRVPDWLKHPAASGLPVWSHKEAIPFRDTKAHAQMSCTTCGLAALGPG